VSVRLAVTAQDERQKSVFASDSIIEPIAPKILGGNQLWLFWGEDAEPQLPHDGSGGRGLQYFPGPGGYRFGMFTIPPSSAAKPEIDDLDDALAEAERLAPGLTHAVTDGAGLHITDTVDFLYVLEGEVSLTVDDGDTRTFSVGDCIVQAGAKHAWANPSADVTCKLLLVFVGGRRLGLSLPTAAGAAGLPGR
jgi:mannose-6-phosphate isomerase-like protein (cupin superfamily)